jgi:serine/threonine protein kinase/Tol biopolymer transport system component
MIGTTVSHYRILEKLGEGGMGVVYKARDLRLDRFVCVKVLRAEQLKDESRKQRFVQEAKSASSLNHPNIITIHEIDEAGGTDFIVMELITGKTLQQLIPSGGLLVRDALRYAIPIASALAAANTAGIIHRDVTPGNIMIGTNGIVKVVDFGLAKLTAAEESADDTTRTIQVQTGEDTIVGTAAYMSPEQAQGKPVDARSDIFSFGAVLYEMLSGRRAFQGANRMSTLAAILHQEPKPLTEIDSRIPRELERVVMRCLRKDPERRFQHMADLKVALEELKEESDSGKLATVQLPGAIRGRKTTIYGLSAAVLLLAVAGSALWRSSRPQKPVQRVFTRLTANGVSFGPTISPDGKMFAYLSLVGGPNPDIWVQQIAGGQPIQITHEKEGASFPVFSPDGTEIAYGAHGDIYEVSALGGDSRLVAADGVGPLYAAGGSLILFIRMQEGWYHLFAVPRMGGTPFVIQPEARLVRSPVVSPDGSMVLALMSRDGRDEQDLARWWTISIPAGKLGEVTPPSLQGSSYAPTPFAWMRDKDSGRQWVVFGRQGGHSSDLFRVAVNGDGKMSSEPEQIVAAMGSAGPPSISIDGRMAFENATSYNTNLWTVPTDTDRARVTGDPHGLTQVEAIRDDSPSLSRDGRMVAYFADRSLAVKNLATGRETQLDPAPFVQFGTPPMISPDGSHVAYNLWRRGESAPDLYLISSSGGPPRRVCEDCGTPRGFSSDGKRVLTQRGSSRYGVGQIALVDVATGKFAIVLSDPQHALWNAYYSWDDKWMSFLVQTGAHRFRIYITPVENFVPAGQNHWIEITSGEYHDHHEQFSPDGNTMYFASNRDGFTCIWALRLDPATKRPLGDPFPIQHFHYSHRMYAGISAPNDMEVCVARDKIVTNLDEYHLDIWMTRLEPGQ